MRAVRWRAREIGWRIGYRLLVLGLHVLALLRFLAVATAMWLHRAHTALAECGDVLVDTLASGEDDEDKEPEDPHPHRDVRVILLPPATRQAEEVRS